MRRSAALLLTGVIHGCAVAAVLIALRPALGVPLSIIVATLLLLVTQPLRRRGQKLVLRRFGSSRERRRALLRSVADELGSAGGGVASPLEVALDEGLRLRCAAAIDVIVDGREVRLLATGAPLGERPAVFPVDHAGRRVGAVLIDAGTAGGCVDESELAVAGELARLGGPSLAAIQLAHVVAAGRERSSARRADERRRLGHELHDRVGPSLAALKMMLAARRRGSASAALRGPELARQAGDIAREVRRVLDQLGPVGVDDHGLVPAVEAMAARLSADRGPRILVEVAGRLPPLEPEVEDALYAIAVEAMSNAVRHAHAGTCIVRLEPGERVRLIVQDDGVGLPPDRPEGVGLVSMRRRAAALGGHVGISPGETGGTRVEAVLPAVPQPVPEGAERPELAGVR